MLYSRQFPAKPQAVCQRGFANFILIILLMISGCGFHLRGLETATLPQGMNKIAISIENVHQEFVDLLSQRFTGLGVQICPTPQQAPYWLILQNEEIHQDISSVSSSTTPRQFQLTYGVHFKLVEANGVEIIPNGFVIATRQLTVNNDRILGSNYEKIQFEQEMRQDLTTQIMARISHCTLHTPP